MIASSNLCYYNIITLYHFKLYFEYLRIKKIMKKAQLLNHYSSERKQNDLEDVTIGMN
jgi:hypothetical protein